MSNMFGFLKGTNRIHINGTDVFINNEKNNISKSIDIKHVFKFDQPVPAIRIYENNVLSRTFKVDTLSGNAYLNNQYLHSSIIIQDNSAVMIDGIISKNDKTVPEWSHEDYEAVRLQPFYLSNVEVYNIALIGKGLVKRGLHYSGTITPSGVRNICICDECRQSFTLQHFHAGFSELQYFYSTNSKQTLVVPYGFINDMPTQLQKEIDADKIEKTEKAFPGSNGDGKFRYYNSFKCPHCFAPYINFEKYKEIRPNEYYGNLLINQKAITVNTY